MALLKVLFHGYRCWPSRCPMTALAWVLWCGLAVSLPAEPTREYQVKAVFLFNFAQFVNWPAGAFADPQAPLIIGVLGDDPFDTVLDEAVRDEKIGARPLLIQRYQRVEDIGICHILFISRSETGRLEQIVARLQNRSILTVGDTDGFSRRGVMIRFLSENNKIRLRINLDATKAASLMLSSKLLRPAEIVTTGRD